MIMTNESVLFTTVPPEKVVEIENAFRAVRTIGEFVDAATLAHAAMYPDNTDPRHMAVRQFNEDINAALVKALGGRAFNLLLIPDVQLLIEDHSDITSSVSGLLLREQNKNKQGN